MKSDVYYINKKYAKNTEKYIQHAKKINEQKERKREERCHYGETVKRKVLGVRDRRQTGALLRK